MKKINVLVFPCGSVTAMDINFSLRYSMNVNIFGASSIDDHGKYIYKNYIGDVPNIADPDFLEAFEKILIQYHIEYIFPTHDSVALFLVDHQDSLSAKVIAADANTTKICRYKSLTYSALDEYGFTPMHYSSVSNDVSFPVFLKPDDGQGGKNSYYVDSYEDLVYYHKKYPSHLICEFLPGDEITVDCFTDRHSQLRFVCERSRDRLLAGVSVHARVLPLEEKVLCIANQINSVLKFRGYWYFQLKKDQTGEYKLLEISTRLAGTACLTKQLDVNFALLSILDFSNQDVVISPNHFGIEVDRSLCGRYSLDIEYGCVYIDLDDTLIFSDGSYNSLALMYLYQCVNNNIEIILITKHEGNVEEFLNNSHIPLTIFTKILSLPHDDPKFLHIDLDKKPIFIDNSFAERKDVREKLGIPCFDISNIECLLDWKG